jgi:hypothetical protein
MLLSLLLLLPLLPKCTLDHVIKLLRIIVVIIIVVIIIVVVAVAALLVGALHCALRRAAIPACSRTFRVARLQVLLAPQAPCSTQHGCAADPADADVRTDRRRPVRRDGRDARVTVAASERAATLRSRSRSCADAGAG